MQIEIGATSGEVSRYGVARPRPFRVILLLVHFQIFKYDQERYKKDICEVLWVAVATPLKIPHAECKSYKWYTAKISNT